MKPKQIIIGYVAMMFSIGLLFQGWMGTRPAQATAPVAEMTDLNSLEPLKQAFQRDRGTVRLVTLLSPI
ncbi:MAG TPA: hypothetical protein VGB07_29095 [Blastocatellia bacterium]